MSNHIQGPIARTLVPRGLYARAALILFLPVVAVTLVVGVMFLQRHFEGVTRVPVGDRVTPTYFQRWVSGDPTPDRFASALGGPLDGVMAEFVCLSQEGVVRVPAYLSAAEAGTLPCAALTAWSAVVTQGATRPGDRVLIQGTGGVALFALAFAKQAGAHVTVISSSDEKLERVRSMGANVTINYRTVEDWARATGRLGRDGTAPS